MYSICIAATLIPLERHYESFRKTCHSHILQCLGLLNFLFLHFLQAAVETAPRGRTLTAEWKKGCLFRSYNRVGTCTSHILNVLCCPRYMFELVRGLDSRSNQYLCCSSCPGRELWVGSILTCPLGLWNIEQQAHLRLVSHRYLCEHRLMDSMLTCKQSPFLNVAMGWTGYYVLGCSLELHFLQSL